MTEPEADPTATPHITTRADIEYVDGLRAALATAEKALKFYAMRPAWTEVETTFAYAPHEWAFDWPGDYGDHPWDIAATALAALAAPPAPETHHDMTRPIWKPGDEEK